MTRDSKEAVHPGAGTIATRFSRAVQLRWQVLGPTRPTALRLFAGESEGLPGVAVDRYGDFVVVQWLSAGALPWRDELYDAITASVAPRAIYEQRRVKPLAGDGPPEPAVRVSGQEAPLETIVEEDGCRFAVDVTAPLGVGFFPDMRLGRDAVARRAADRRVLNLFSYTGAFSVRAAKAGAS
jgi:23S rRNA (cytosine1962-C5)-methyltransferase